MTYKFFPHTDDDIRQMLAKIGIGSLEDLYAGLPEEVKFKGEYDMPEAMSEQEVRDVLGSPRRTPSSPASPALASMITTRPPPCPTSWSAASF